MASLSKLNLMFIVKTWVYPIEEPFRCSTLGLAPGLAHIPYSMLERLSMDKHSSLLRKFLNHGQKKFYNIGPCLSVSEIFDVICCEISEEKGKKIPLVDAQRHTLDTS
jgi:hypothetical protein